jgi:eukaryotic-like serine/threonine-protein kinase
MLVGRENVLEILFDACTGIPAGKASVIELTGPSGYGKTKILDAFFAAAADRFPEALIVRGRCYEHESVPFKAVDEMMEQLSRELRRLGPAANRYLPDEIGLLARLFPVLEQVQPVSRIQPRNPVEITNPWEVRRRGFLALADLLQRLSTSRQIVICLDGLQWDDADSAAVFQYLLHAKPIVPLMLIASHQSGVELSRVPAIVAQGPGRRPA